MTGRKAQFPLDKSENRTYDRTNIKLITKGYEKEEYADTPVREQNPSAVRFCGTRCAEGSF